MWIKQLVLTQFRNLTHAQLGFSPHLNLILGRNAAGKSNILEAITVLSRGKSPRTSRDRELLHFDAQEGRATAVAEQTQLAMTRKLEMTLQCSPNPNDPSNPRCRSLFRLDDNRLKSRSLLVGKLPTVTFYLSDLLLLRGTPSDRRAALDSLLMQWKPSYLAYLMTYQRLREQKAAYLKQVQKHGGQADYSVLSTLNNQLHEAGMAVMQQRIEGLVQLEPVAKTYWQSLSPDGDELSFCYWPSFMETPDTLNGPLPWMSLEPEAMATLSEQFRVAIEAASTEECRRGQVVVGPHRDDLKPYLNGRDACAFSSQGQQRSIVLAFKLSEIELLSRAYEGEFPILLLDDVMAELDPYRQHQLIRHLNPAMQVILTTTHLDEELIKELGEFKEVKVFSVQGGQVELRQDGLHNAELQTTLMQEVPV